MSKKEELKTYLKSSPREKRLELEAYIDEQLLESDAWKALDFVKEMNERSNYPHSITEIGYSDSSFFVKTEAGVSFL